MTNLDLELACLTTSLVTALCATVVCLCGFLAFIVAALIAIVPTLLAVPLRLEAVTAALAPSGFANASSRAVDFEGFRRRRGAKSAEPASLLYRDVESERGLFERLAAARASSSRELILLTSDRKQLDLALNLIENLRELGLRHYLLLAQDAAVCEALAPRRVIACAWSSHLASAENTSALRAAGTRDSMSRLWLQRQHYVGRLVGAAINTLLLDSDVVLSRDPYPYLKAPPFSRFHAIVLGDSTGAATPLHINGGVWYVQNASTTGPLRAFYADVDAAVASQMRQRRASEVGLFDQTTLNRVLDWSRGEALRRSSTAVGWHARMAHNALLWPLTPLVEPRWEWRCCERTPAELPAPGGTYGRSFGYRWLAIAGGTGGEERVMKAPAWLFSAESDQAPPSTRVRLGAVRVDATAWAAAPWVLLHFVCSAWPGSDGRRQAMRAWGRWRHAAVARELPAARAKHDQLRRAMIGYAAPLDAPSQPAARAALKLLAAAAAALGRTPVLPALRCAQPLLQKRCAWLVPPSRDGGDPECLLRWPSGCADAMLLPAEARAAAGTSARTLAPRAAAALLAAVAAGAEPPAGLAAPAEGAPAARLLLLDLREPAAIAAAADALERNDSRVQCKGRAQMRHRVCRVRAAACQIHRVERCQAVC